MENRETGREISTPGAKEQIRRIKQMVTVKGPVSDVVSFFTHISIRKKKFKKASEERLEIPYINTLSKSLHPPVQQFEITGIKEEAPDVKTFLLQRQDGFPALFRAGQYIVIETKVNGVKVSRPFSLSLSPEECLKEGVYKITVKKNNQGFLSRKAVDFWEEGLKLSVSQPMGNFYYTPLRDSKRVLFFAGGSGITPFRSIIPSLLNSSLPGDHRVEQITLFYGISRKEEFLFEDFFNSLMEKNKNRFKIVPVLSEEDPAWIGERGFIGSDLILKYDPRAKEGSWFICGPAAMKRSVKDIAEGWNIRRKNIRFESFSPEKPKSNRAPQQVCITVHCEGETVVVEGSTDETVVSSLDRAGLNPPVYCRSGDCGWCRSRLISGEVEVPEEVSGVRKADYRFGYFHPCSSFPKGDLEIRINRNPLGD